MPKSDKNADAAKKSNNSPIQVNRSRGGGKKKIDLFANLRNTEHPLDDLIPPPAVHAEDEMPSTTPQQSRPQEISVDDRVFDNQPSTDIQNDRPQYQAVPSTENKVDGEELKVDVLPSTKGEKTESPAVIPSTTEKPDVHTKFKKPSTKGDRHNKNLARFDNRIDPALKRRIELFCAQEDIFLRDFVEMAAVHLMDVWTSTKIENVDGKTALDDRRSISLWKTQPRIINLYLAYNSIFNDRPKWNLRDDDAGLPFNNVDIRVIELGLIQTQGNKGFSGKINSFSYYIPEIKNFMALNMPGATLDMMLEVNRQRWRQATGRELDLNFLKNISAE